jgi:hypothetical protein
LINLAISTGHVHHLQAMHTLGELVKTAIFNPTSCALLGEVWLVSRKQGLAQDWGIHFIGVW